MNCSTETQSAGATIAAFTEAIFDPDDIVEIRYIKAGEDGRSNWFVAATLPSRVTELVLANENGANIYVGANPRPKIRAKGDDCIELARCAFVDFDDSPDDELAVERIRAAGLPDPNLVACTGHGIHCYWRFVDPCLDLQAWKTLQADLTELLGSDRKIKNPERVMRLPGLLNVKRDPVPTSIASIQMHERISFEQLRALVPHIEPKPIPTRPRVNGNDQHVDDALRVKRARAYIQKMPSAISGQGGHDATMAVAGETQRFGLSDADAWAVLVEYNSRCDPPWSERELQHKLDDAQKLNAGEFGSRLQQDRPANGGDKKSGCQKSDKAISPSGQRSSPQELINYGGSIDPPPADRATELANAEELHRRHGANIKFHVDRGEYFVCDGRHWGRDVDGQVERWTKDVARASAERLVNDVDRRDLGRFQKSMESARGVSSVLKLLETEPGISATADAFDRDIHLLNARNGTIDMRTGKLLPHDPRNLITHCLSTPFDANAKCTKFESVVARSFADDHELIAYFQRWCGLACTGVPNVHELLIAYGSGANGKSVLFDTLCGLLESLAGVAPESLLMARHGQSEHPTEIADLLGKRLVIASETEAGGTMRLQMIKRLTGDATIKARFMRQDFFEFRRTHKLVLITNNRPRLTENTEAVWRRLRLLPFNVVIPPAERDPHLLEKLKAEYPGILAWCVRGFLDFQQNGMKPPSAVLVATEDYRNEADELAEFIAAKCGVGDAEVLRVSRADLHAAYASWAKSCNERNPLERNALYEAIRRRDGIREDAWKIDGKVIRGFRGIAIVKTMPEGSDGCR